MTGNYKISVKRALSISRTKELSRNPLVGSLEKLVKNTQVSLICHDIVKRNQETGNRQTDKLL